VEVTQCVVREAVGVLYQTQKREYAAEMNDLATWDNYNTVLEWASSDHTSCPKYWCQRNEIFITVSVQVRHNKAKGES
jgi:hypothetical protein